eukprot:PhM_4_TR8474/c0_g1_i1/m.104071
MLFFRYVWNILYTTTDASKEQHHNHTPSSLFYYYGSAGKDSLSQQIRKVSVAFGMFGVLFAIIKVLLSVAEGIENYWSLKQYFAHVTPSLFGALSLLFVWVHMKADNHVSDTLFKVFYSSIHVTLLGVQLVTPEYTHYASFVGAPTLGIMSGIDPVFAVVCSVVGFVVAGYNETLGSEQVDTDNTFPTLSIARQDPTVVGSVMTFLISAVMFTASIVLVLRQYKTHEKMISSVDKCDDLLLLVTELLVKYKTVAAANAINAALEADEGTHDIDPSFCQLLWRIVRTMDNYKPHIPGYLRGADDDGDDGVRIKMMTSASEDDDFEATTSDDIHGTGSLVSFANTSSRGGGGTASRSTSVSAVRSSLHAAKESLNVSSVASSPISPHAASGDFEHKSSPTSSLSFVPQHQENPLVVPNSSHNNVVSKKRISIALLEASLVKGSCDSLATTVPEHKMRTLNAYFEAVTGLCDSTRGVAHHFWGDVLHISWNTARRVAQPEVHAAMFLSRCRDVLTSSSSATPVAAACTGDGVFSLCGRRQVVPVVHCMWLNDLECLFKSYATKLCANVCDDGTARACHHAVLTRGFASVERDTAASSATTMTVYEVMRERDSTMENDEWMYALEKQQRRDAGTNSNINVEAQYAAMTKATMHGIVGEFELGLDCLARVGLWHDENNNNNNNSCERHNENNVILCDSNDDDINNDEDNNKNTNTIISHSVIAPEANINTTRDHINRSHIHNNDRVVQHLVNSLFDGILKRSKTIVAVSK